MTHAEAVLSWREGVGDAMDLGLWVHEGNVYKSLRWWRDWVERAKRRAAGEMSVKMANVEGDFD